MGGDNNSNGSNGSSMCPSNLTIDDSNYIKYFVLNNLSITSGEFNCFLYVVLPITYMLLLLGLFAWFIYKAERKIRLIKYDPQSHTYSRLSVWILRVLQLDLFLCVVLKSIEIYFVTLGDKYPTIFLPIDDYWKIWRTSSYMLQEFELFVLGFVIILQHCEYLSMLVIMIFQRSKDIESIIERHSNRNLNWAFKKIERRTDPRNRFPQAELCVMSVYLIYVTGFSFNAWLKLAEQYR